MARTHPSTTPIHSEMIQTLAEMHAIEIAELREFAMLLKARLSDAMVSPPDLDVSCPPKMRLWGDKEDALSVLMKLTGLMVKLVPLEQALLERSEAQKQALAPQAPPPYEMTDVDTRDVQPQEENRTKAEKKIAPEAELLRSKEAHPVTETASKTGVPHETPHHTDGPSADPTFSPPTPNIRNIYDVMYGRSP